MCETKTKLAHSDMQMLSEQLRLLLSQTKSNNVNTELNLKKIVNLSNSISYKNIIEWEGLLRNFFVKPKSGLIFNRLNKTEEDLINWIEIVNFSGYIRESSIKKLCSSAPSGFFFILLLRRLNDWVENVRKTAREKILEIGCKTDPAIVVEALMVVFKDLNSWQRMKQVDIEVLYQLLSINEIKVEMKNQLITSASGPQAKILLNILKRIGFDEYLIEIAKNSIQPSLRSMVYRILLQKNVLWVASKEKQWLSHGIRSFKIEVFYDQRPINIEYEFENILSLAAIDRSSIVRRVAAEFLIKEIDNIEGDAIQMAKKFANDKSKPVYERGQFALKRLKIC